MRWTPLIAPVSDSPPRSSLLASSIPALATLLAGMAVIWGALALAAISGAHAFRAAAGAQPLVEITHLPPLLTADDDGLGELRYDISCTTPGIDPDPGCDVAGTVYVRAGQSGPFTPLDLQLDSAAPTGRYVVELPAEISASPSGFSYYAVVTDRRSGATTTLPAGGAIAPQRSFLLAHAIAVDLGSHGFGATTPPSARVARAAWGDGPTEVGLEEGPQLEPIGASSFDVDPAGKVVVLDEAHRRLLRFAAGPSHPAAVPVAVRGTIADLASQADGSAYVLESVGEPGTTPLLRRFDSSGHAIGAWHVAEPGVSALRHGGGALEALEYPASQWMHVATASVSESTTSGRPGRAIEGGRELVSQREGREARVAIVGPNGVARSWRIFSDTPLAEIQLVEPRGKDVVAVLRTYSDSDAEYLVLVLGRRGVVRQLSIPAADWAETAPLARFRLVGSSLFHLGSTRSEMFVDRYDLEVSA